MSNVGARKRKSDAPSESSKKARKGGSMSMLRPRIVRPVDAPKPGDKLYQVTRLVHLDSSLFLTPTLCTDGGGYQGVGQIDFSLNQLPNYLAWTACFREYRITKCEVLFHPRWNTTAASGTAANHLILGHVQTDYGPAFTSAPYTATENAWLNVTGYRQQDFSNGSVVKVAVYPSPAISTLITPTNFAGAVGMPSTWLSTSQPTVPHSGLAWRLYNPQATSNDGLVGGEIYCRFSVQFRTPI